MITSEIGLLEIPHLVAPGEALLGDFLAAAEKPFLVTGVAAVPASLKDKIIAKKVVWGVDYDPEDVPAGLARADAADAISPTSIRLSTATLMITLLIVRKNSPY